MQRIVHKNNIDKEEQWVKEKLKRYTKSLEKGAIYFVKGNEVYRAELFDGAYYQLKLYKGYPMLEINGFRMQNIKGFETVFDYAKEVVRLLKPEGNILECCFGLGYLTKELLKYGRVTSVEKSSAVLELAKINPYSKEALEKAKVINKDIVEFLEQDKEIYDTIVHDPPSISQAPELYSKRFYEMISKHSRKGTRLYHYTGEPGIKQQKRLYERVMKDLETLGWKTRYYKKVKGIVAIKED